MCRIVEELIEEEKVDMILKMKKMGKWSNEDIAEITGFTVEQIEAIGEPKVAVVN